MITTETNQKIIAGLEALTEKSTSAYADRLDAKNVMNEINVRSRHEAMDRYPNDVQKEVEAQILMEKGQYEAYLLVLGEKFKHINQELSHQEQKQKLIKEYMERNYENYLLESKTIQASELKYAIEDNVCSDVELIASEIFQFCHKKLINIKW